MKQTVTAIIVNWNTNDRLEHILSQLIPNENLHIVVVDNNSLEKPTYLSKKYSEVRFIFNVTNKGYAAACNQGALYAKGEWLFFLNADVELNNTTIEMCVNEAIEKKLAAASPLSEKAGYNKPLPSLLSLTIEFSPLKNIIPLSIFKRKTLFGGALLIKKDVFLSLKGWDERFFVWFEDSDLTKRLYDSGQHIGWLSVQVGHKGGASFTTISNTKRGAIFFQSLNIYLRKHHGLLVQIFIELLTRRFWHGFLYPKLHSGISLVIPNMKKQILLDFLEKNAKHLSEIDECIVVSSNMDADMLWLLRKKYEHIRFISIDGNAGFAHTVNIGMRVSTGNYIGTCNDDTILTSSTFSCIEHVPKDTGSINPIIKNVDGSIESAGITILPRGKAETIKEVSEEAFYLVDATNGACVMYSREVLEEVGLFDEKFGSYLEDIDLALRCTKAGYKNYVHNDSEITHVKHQTSSSLGAKKQWLDFKNWLLVILKNRSLEKLIANLPQILIERLRNLSGILKAL